MNIRIVTPAPARSRKGNRITAVRWARILRDLGHRVRIDQAYSGGPCDLLIALHARRSFPAAERFARRHPGLPLVVALTGTDLYGDIRVDSQAQASLALATRLVVLQPMAVAEIPRHLRHKVRVIYQSAMRPARRLKPRKDVFEVLVLGHLREVKDPFRAAMAARLLPAASRVQIIQVGAALSEEMAELARAEAEDNPRYRWLGELPRWKALRLLTRARVLVLSSKMEGGANVISEAVAASVPVAASRIPATVGVLGPEYPAYFPVGDTAALAALLERVEADESLHRSLKEWCERLYPLVDPKHERAGWADLLREDCMAAPLRRTGRA